MTATNELRRLLDERGVEWERHRGGLPTETTYEHGGIDWMAVERTDGTLHLYCRTFLTPEQAIEATLGSDLQAENDKLRELVRDMFTTISWCDLDCYPSDGKKRELADRMRELGVEVPDGRVR